MSPSPGEDANPDIDVVPSAPIDVQPGDAILKDPAAEVVVQFNWDRRYLAASVTINDSTFEVSALRPVGESPAALTVDLDTVEGNLRKTRLRIKGGTLGGYYNLANTITTNENPPQIKRHSIFVTIERQ